MVITGKSIDRRTFLYGTGAALALPLLDAMTPAFAVDAARPTRLGFFQVPERHHEPAERVFAKGRGRTRNWARFSSRSPTSRTAC